MKLGNRIDNQLVIFSPQDVQKDLGKDQAIKHTLILY